MATNGDDMGRWMDDGGAPGPEPKPATVVPLTEAERFYYDHAGWVVGPGETESEGRVRSARSMVEAQQWAIAQGMDFTWEPDEDYYAGAVDGLVMDNGPAYGCMVRRPGSRVVLASLWGITFGKYAGPGRDPYCRVVEAELAAELMYVAEADAAMQAASPEMRALVQYAEIA